MCMVGYLLSRFEISSERRAMLTIEGWDVNVYIDITMGCVGYLDWNSSLRNLSLFLLINQAGLTGSKSSFLTRLQMEDPALSVCRYFLILKKCA